MMQGGRVLIVADSLQQSDVRLYLERVAGAPDVFYFAGPVNIRSRSGDGRTVFERLAPAKRHLIGSMRLAYANP